MVMLGAVAATAAVFTAQAEDKPAQNESAKAEAAEAEESENEEESKLFEVALQLDVKSAYVSHNRIFSDTPVAQYDVWMQLNLPEKFGWIALSSLFFSWSGRDAGSQKFWTVGAEYDNKFVVPSVKFFWEYCHDNKPDEAFMIDFALSRSFELTEQLSLKLTSKTTLYTSEYAKYISGGALTDTVFGGWDNGIALSYALTDNISLGANLNYLYKLDHRVRHCPGWDSYSVDSRHGSHDGLLYGGVSVSFAF